jgi:hypothetical protein
MRLRQAYLWHLRSLTLHRIIPTRQGLLASDLLFDFVDILCGRGHVFIKELPNYCIALFHLQQEILTRYTRLFGHVLSE